MSWLDTLTIEAEADPILTIRISALVAAENTMPVALEAIDLMTGQMRIVVVLRNVDAQQAAHLASRIENIPTVSKVRASRIWRRESAPALRAQSAI